MEIGHKTDKNNDAYLQKPLT